MCSVLFILNIMFLVFKLLAEKHKQEYKNTT